MCTTSACDLEDIPLDDDDPDSMEFKILEFYVKHHVFKNTSAVLSPKPLRTRSLSQRGPGPAIEAWAQGPWPCSNSQSSEKAVHLAKKKSSWRTLFGVVEKEDDSQSSPPEIRAQGQRAGKPQSGPRSHQRPLSLSTAERRLEHQAVDPKVVSIANRVAEIVYSWPPPEEQHNLLKGGGFQSTGTVVRQGLRFQGPQPKATSAKKVDDEGPRQVLSLHPARIEGSSSSSKSIGISQPQKQGMAGLFSAPGLSQQFGQGPDAEVVSRPLQSGLRNRPHPRVTRRRLSRPPVSQALACWARFLVLPGPTRRKSGPLKKDKALMNSFQDGLTYPVFKTITDQFLRGVDTRGESEVKVHSFKAALAIDAMSKLTAVDNHPMNKVLGFGAKYLKENFTPWIQQHGGWDGVAVRIGRYCS
ncbi:apoptosis facilitator Bcl-2-like protein [Camelus ferus]|nr:apoptosis facilitator Bcl-2-like protein [Camelus ferus]